ncbi:hypothetical protein SAMN04487913_103132 [Arthrobacter sp. ok362]|nr:hypothetical protein SAMN04487913_103132 [Arthrobacter sp. ok362]
MNPEDPRENPGENPREGPGENPRGNDGEHPGEDSLRNPDATAPGAAAGNPVRPRGIVVIAVVVALEATALLVAGGWYGTQLLTGAPVLSFWGAVFTLFLLLAFSAWLFAVARFLLRGFRWPRAGALVAQFFVLTIGFPTLTGGYPLAGLAMLIPAVTTIVLLFDKRVIAFASRAAGAPPAL